MADFCNDAYRSDRQRRRFPVKFNEDQRRQIVVMLALGYTVAQVHAWATKEWDRECSYNAIRGYLKRARWQRFMNTIRKCELDDPTYTLCFTHLIQDTQKRWDRHEKTFFECLKMAVSKERLDVEDFIKAARVLNGMRWEPPMRILRELGLKKRTRIEPI